MGREQSIICLAAPSSFHASYSKQGAMSSFLDRDCTHSHFNPLEIPAKQAQPFDLTVFLVLFFLMLLFTLSHIFLSLRHCRCLLLLVISQSLISFKHSASIFQAIIPRHSTACGDSAICFLLRILLRLTIQDILSRLCRTSLTQFTKLTLSPLPLPSTSAIMDR